MDDRAATTASDAARGRRGSTACARSRGCSTRRSACPARSWRFGIDALFGLVPGLGDLAGAVVAVYALHVARSCARRASIQLHMLSNIAVDALVGTIPVIGDLFDFVFKAQTRNLALLDDWLAVARTTRRGAAGAG